MGLSNSRQTSCEQQAIGPRLNIQSPLQEAPTKHNERCLICMLQISKLQNELPHVKLQLQTASRLIVGKHARNQELICNTLLYLDRVSLFRYTII